MRLGTLGQQSRIPRVSLGKIWASPGHLSGTLRVPIKPKSLKKPKGIQKFQIFNLEFHAKYISNPYIMLLHPI